MISRVVRDNSYGWMVVGICFVSLMLVYAVRSSLGLMMPFWEDDPGWTRDLSSDAGALVLVLMAISSPIAGNLIDRYGPRPVCSAGLACLGAGVFAVTLSSEAWHLILSYGGLIGIGAGAIAMPMVSAAVAIYFKSNQGLASGIGFSGATGGQLFAMPALGVLVTWIGWRGTYVAMGVAIFIFAAAVWLMLRSGMPREGTREPVSREPLGARLKVLATSRTFWLLFLGFIVCGFTTAGVIEVHLLPYAELCGFGPIEGATAYGIYGGFNMVGVILLGILADRMHRPRLLAALYFLRAILFVVLLNITGSLTLLFVFAAAYGFTSFATLPVLASIIASRIGVGIMGLAMGIVFAGHWAGGALGAYFGGELYRLYANYDWMWIVAMIAVLFASFLSLCIPEERHRDMVPQPA
jgi:predicted MFS family arabinose efflux permease